MHQRGCGMYYDLNRFVNLSILLSAQVESNKLFEVILKEAMMIGNCDAGTIYLFEDNALHFKHVITKSQKVSFGPDTGADSIPPVPMSGSYVCAYATMQKKRLNIPDVYKSSQFDFSGTKQYDKMNNYHTGSMLVVPMAVGNDPVTGVIQLINAMDEKGNLLDSNGNTVKFDTEQEHLVTALGSVSALFIENRRLKGTL